MIADRGAALKQIDGIFIFPSPAADQDKFWRRGAVALWLDRDGVTVESANESRGDRPWVPHPRPARRKDPAAAESGQAYPHL